VTAFGRAVLAAVLLAFAAPSPAQTSPAIQSARQAGIVGERYDGYLGLAARPPEVVRRQVGAVNIKRRKLYIELASRRNVSPEAVGIAAGCELLAEVKVGEVYMLNDGVWRRRAPGQPAPVPAYCAR
jgi:uncharacterized protein YdbL (DUF1318 family)